MTQTSATNGVTVSRCRSCGSAELSPVLDLGDQPASDLFPAVGDPEPDPRWPLALVLCAECALLQLSHVSPVPEAPRAVESRTMLHHATDVAATVLRRLAADPPRTVHEFDSHHGGSWLPALTGSGVMVPGPDETADLVVDNHSIIHEEDFEGALAERVRRLSASGRLVIEFHHALRLVQGTQFDTVRHGHPVYLSLSAWSHALERHGLRVLDAWPEPVYGGCLVVVAGRSGEPSAGVRDILEEERAAGIDETAGYAPLAGLVAALSRDLREYLVVARDEGRLVLGYGAPSKAAVLLGVSGVDRALLAATADLSPDKHGRRVPGAGVPIVSPEELTASAPDEVLVLTWDIADEVIAQLTELREAGVTFVTPIPRVRRLP